MELEIQGFSPVGGQAIHSLQQAKERVGFFPQLHSTTSSILKPLLFAHFYLYFQQTLSTLREFLLLDMQGI